MDVLETRSFFIKQVRSFLDTAVKNCASRKTNEIRCPCRDRQNKNVWHSPDLLKRRLVQRGFMSNYEI
jgi:hypothetical protein